MKEELMFLCLLITRMQELLGHRQQFWGSGSGLRFSVQKKDTLATTRPAETRKLDYKIESKDG